MSLAIWPSAPNTVVVGHLSDGLPEKLMMVMIKKRSEALFVLSNGGDTNGGLRLLVRNLTRANLGEPHPGAVFVQLAAGMRWVCKVCASTGSFANTIIPAMPAKAASASFDLRFIVRSSSQCLHSQSQASATLECSPGA
jgi:hypothetical protein